MPLTVAIVAEGPTDVAVIENIVAGITGERSNAFTYVRPPSVLGSYADSDISSWSQVMAYCKSSEFPPLFDYVDLVVVQVDTDQYDPVHFKLPTHEDGAEISPARKYDLVGSIIGSWIGGDQLNRIAGKLVYAISIDSIECWLLPLAFPTSKATRSKTKNCAEALKRHEKARTLVKSYRSYQEFSRPYAKQSEIVRLAPMNYSLGRFVEAFQDRLAAQSREMGGPCRISDGFP